MLLLSQERPDLCKAADQFGSSEWETISYEPLLERVVKGSQWHFRLVANPTISRSQGSGKRGKIYAHSSTRFQREWLLKKAEKHGFLIDEDQFDIKGSQWFRFRKKGSIIFLVGLAMPHYRLLIPSASLDMNLRQCFRVITPTATNSGTACFLTPRRAQAS